MLNPLLTVYLIGKQSSWEVDKQYIPHHYPSLPAILFIPLHHVQGRTLQPLRVPRAPSVLAVFIAAHESHFLPLPLLCWQPATVQGATT